MIPICYFPTQVVLIDDDSDFLSNLEVLLDRSQASYVQYTSPKKALDYINNEASPLALDPAFLEEKDAYELGKESFYLNYSAIKNMALNPNRFSELSTVVVDYNMPNMNGLQLLQSIQHKNVKKILLTGEADEYTAIDAFNKGIIDQFIRKQDPNLISKVNDAIALSQLQAFTVLTQKSLPPSLSSRNSPIFQNIPEFEEYFFKEVKKHGISEFYLADSQGAFLLLDGDANASGLFVRSEDHFQALESEVLGEAEIPESIQQDIQSRKKVLCYLPSADQIFPEDHEIEKFLQPAHQFSSEKGSIYAAYMPEFDFFKNTQFTPFSQYLTSRS